MKAKIFKDISCEKFIKIAPKKYKHIISLIPDTGLITAIFFGDDEVILSGVIKKAIKHIDFKMETNIYAIGRCFTSEAISLLKDNNIEAITLSDFHWTDESYIKIVQNQI